MITPDTEQQYMVVLKGPWRTAIAAMFPNQELKRHMGLPDLVTTAKPKIDQYIEMELSAQNKQ